MGRLQAALRAGVSAFVQSWQEHAEKTEKAVAERYLKREEQRNEVVQAAYATLSANDQHFLMHFTENLEPDQRPDYAHVKRIAEMCSSWSQDAQRLLQKELVQRCAPILLVPAFTKWMNSAGVTCKVSR